jgi:hypothetical protein
MAFSFLQLIKILSVKCSSSVVEEAEEPIQLKALQNHGQQVVAAAVTFDI